MIREILVDPAQGGWTLRYPGALEPLVFLSGAKAEDAARRLGMAIADGGEHAEIRIFLRDGSLAGRFVCAPEMF
jgi:hypothetical protein